MAVAQETAQTTVVVRPGEGETLHAFGDTIQVKLRGEDTGGSLAVGYATTPPGAGPPIHRHRNEDELFLTIQGQMQFLVNGEWKDVGPGSVVYLPRGIVHTFRNVGDAPAHHWVLLMPSGFERFFGKCADEFGKGAAPDMARILGICEEHGIEILESPSPQS